MVDPTAKLDYERFIRESAIIYAGGSMLAGLAVLTMGIVAPMGTIPAVLNVVSLLVIGGDILLSASPLNSSVVNTFGHRIVETPQDRHELRHAA